MFQSNMCYSYIGLSCWLVDYLTYIGRLLIFWVFFSIGRLIDWPINVCPHTCAHSINYWSSVNTERTSKLIGHASSLVIERFIDLCTCSCTRPHLLQPCTKYITLAPGEECDGNALTLLALFCLCSHTHAYEVSRKRTHTHTHTHTHARTHARSHARSHARAHTQNSWHQVNRLTLR